MQRFDRMRSATLRQLRAFAAVARHQSFVRAAAELHLTPSAISLQIKELEQVIGIPLFSRNGKGVLLTDSGDVLLAYVNKALLSLKQAEEALTRTHGHDGGQVSLGIVSNAEYFLPLLLSRFRSQHPHVELRVTVGNRAQMVRQLSNREIELAIIGSPPREIEAHAEAFAPQPLGIVASPRHPLAGSPALEPERLDAHEFIVREPGSGTRAAMEAWFLEAGISPPRALEVSSNETIKRAVVANMGLAFLSLHTVGLELQTGRLVALDVVGLPVVRRWHVVAVGKEPASELAERLRRFVAREGARLVAEHFPADFAAAPFGADDAMAGAAPTTSQ
ncbi:MAG TPA: LysR family transcriptional regulator [Burkholderiaceae bacterium]|nr:LysR family transcriptional regulator [Burkholderiaceae bacterium]